MCHAEIQRQETLSLGEVNVALLDESKFIFKIVRTKTEGQNHVKIFKFERFSDIVLIFKDYL